MVQPLASEPGDFFIGSEVGSVAERDVENLAPSDVLPRSMVDDLQSAGWVYLYDTLTGERSLCNRNMAGPQLQVKRADGTPVFSQTMPAGVVPFVGVRKCFLHPAQPDHSRLMAQGLKPCFKSNLPNEYQENNHNKNRHPAEWAGETRRIEQEERETDRALQRAFLQAVQGNLPTPTSPPLAVDGAASPTAPETVTNGFLRIEGEAVNSETTTNSASFTHQHMYGKQMGSQCKHQGCEEVRKIPYKARK